MFHSHHQRSLCKVWGYMWTLWYVPKVWKLWAHSTSRYISRLRTTTGVENFWKQLKHDYLHHLLRPQLDQLVWILNNMVTPLYVARTEVQEDSHRLGPSKALTTYQIYFKAPWTIQEKAHINGLRQYFTDVETWTCTCGQQKYDRHHICKHLVQAIPHPPLKFWRKVIRQRVIPIYRHPALVCKADNDGPGPATSYVDPDDGSIMDGDNHIPRQSGVFAW